MMVRVPEICSSWFCLLSFLHFKRRMGIEVILAKAVDARMPKSATSDSLLKESILFSQEHTIERLIRY